MLLPIDDPIEPSLQFKFQAEKLFRTIKESDDIEVLREIAAQLLKLNLSNSAVANWATKRAAESEISRIHSKSLIIDRD